MKDIDNGEPSTQEYYYVLRDFSDDLRVSIHKTLEDAKRLLKINKVPDGCIYKFKVNWDYFDYHMVEVYPKNRVGS